MSEAEDFIEENKDGKPASTPFSVNLGDYANRIDTINKQQSLSYSWITYKVPA
jgi:hypothetical protein